MGLSDGPFFYDQTHPIAKWKSPHFEPSLPNGSSRYFGAVCLIIHVFCKSCEPETVLVLICPFAEQFRIHRIYKKRESTLSCIGYLEENMYIGICLIFI